MNNYYENETLQYMLRDAESHIYYLYSELGFKDAKIQNLQLEINRLNDLNEYNRKRANGQLQKVEPYRVSAEARPVTEEAFDEYIENTKAKSIDFKKLGELKPTDKVETKPNINFNRIDFSKIGKTGKNRKQKNNYYVAVDSEGTAEYFSTGQEAYEYVKELGYKGHYNSVTGNIATACKKGIKKYNRFWSIVEGNVN